MVRDASLIAGLVLAVLTAGCSKAPAPPPDTRAADLEIISEVETASHQAAANKDVEKWAAFFAEDASGLFPGDKMLNGKAAIEGAIATYFADPDFSLKLQATRAMASRGGDMAYSQGTYIMTRTNPMNKKPMTVNGKYLTVYTKQADGSWKAVAHAFNADSPG